MPTAGLEPARPFELRILSPLRLPFRQAGMWVSFNGVPGRRPELSVANARKWTAVEKPWQTRTYRSEVAVFVQEMVEDAYGQGLTDKRTMREFDESCSPQALPPHEPPRFPGAVDRGRRPQRR
jgi:hypothetical protein